MQQVSPLLIGKTELLKKKAHSDPLYEQEMKIKNNQENNNSCIQKMYQGLLNTRIHKVNCRSVGRNIH
jgi:hypothetical protein